MDYDFIIVGAGSAGCVLANRLSEDPAARVLLLEAGGRDSHPLIHMPAGIARLAGNTRINWGYYTEPQAQLNQRRLWWPRGKVLGGSSSINAMCYIRAQPEDYDHWAALGNPGWSWAEVFPLFLRSQHQERGGSEFHATGGYLNVKDLDYVNPLSHAFVKAGVSAGYPLNGDFNSGSQEGVGLYQVTQRGGRRCSLSTSFLAAAAARSNLTVMTRALATRVLLQGSRARGVEFVRNGRLIRATASSEVVLSGGAINSPQLLMLSGIGPAGELRRVGVVVKHDLPGVGKNLQDHLDICTIATTERKLSYDFSLWQEALVGLRYLLTRKGAGTSNAAEAGAFVCSALSDGRRPDVQLHFVPAQLDDHGRNRLPGHGYTVHACALRPTSRGEITLRSQDPLTHPRIAPNYLTGDGDLALMLEGVRISREIFAKAPFDPYRGRELLPGESARTPAQLVQFIRSKAETIYHPVGTCSMGHDAMSVVDSELRVRGLEGLRVVDASIMPTLVSGNTNAPTVMIAEKASDMIRGLGSTRKGNARQAA